MEVIQSSGLEYFDIGTGEPVLFVHAGGFSDWFAPLAETSAMARYRRLLIRRSGYGATTPKAPLSIADHAAHLAELLDLLRLKKVHVVGHSSGALIAIDLAIAHQDLVQTLTLIEPAACGPFQVPAIREIGERFVRPAIAFSMAGNLSAAFDSFMQGICGEEYRGILEAALTPAGLQKAISQSDYFFRDEAPAAMQWQLRAEEAQKLILPILVVEGANGRSEGMLSQQVTEVAMRLFPHSELVLIDGANHMVPLQQPHALGDAIASFFKRHTMADPNLHG